MSKLQLVLWNCSLGDFSVTISEVTADARSVPTLISAGKRFVRQEGLAPRPNTSTVTAYFEVLKPKETSLLIFVGICSAIAGAGGQFDLSRFLLVLVTVGLLTGGVNGLTNYLDRDVDARMIRTRHRSIPSKQISPPERALIFTATVTAIGLGLAWVLHPYCFAAGLVGTIAAGVVRKTVLCPVLGGIASCSPVLIGWLAFDQSLGLPIGLICLLIVIWVPLHVWSVMIANREDYRSAGLRYFPLSHDPNEVVKVFPWLAVAIYGCSMALYFVGDFKQIYLVVTNILGILLVYASLRLNLSYSWRDAWRVYKISAFPYLGVLFLGICLDVFLLW
ncbi:MAG: protoheme IX farnesyltransferase [Dehalococcoidia bacterium]